MLTAGTEDIEVRRGAHGSVDRVIRIRRRGPALMGAVFAVSGVAHFVRPRFFEAIMPRAIPAGLHRSLITLSGLAELTCAVGLVRRASWARPASVAVLAGVFPANVQMALDSGTGRNPGLADSRVLAWGRLPLQFLMMWAAFGARREDSGAR